MILKSCIMTNSTCYKGTSNITKVTGIVVHSTGANNPYIKRYVQPLTTDVGYKAIINDIGKNKYNNDWNHIDVEKGVHAFIGKNEKGEIRTYQVLPYTKCAWGVGAIPLDKNGKEVPGAKDPRFHHWSPSYNFNPQARIQFEICEDGLNDEKYFRAVMKEAQEYCAMLCKKFNLDPMKQICSHYESYKAGYGCNHGDPHHWMKKFGMTMDDFRKGVQQLLTPVSNIKIGDLVEFTGTSHYTNSNGTIGRPCKPGKARVTSVKDAKKNKRPYHLIAVKGEGSTVYGWVSASDVKVITNADTQKNAPYQCIHTCKKGDTFWKLAVQYLGKGNRYTEIMSLNNIKTTTVSVGLKLKIPHK